MPKFSRPKRPSTEEPEGLKAFAAGATVRSVNKPEKPWEAFDPDAPPTKGMNLRLNEYELALLRFVAAEEDRSAQKTLRRLVLEALETKAGLR